MFRKWDRACEAVSREKFNRLIQNNAAIFLLHAVNVAGNGAKLNKKLFLNVVGTNNRPQLVLHKDKTVQAEPLLQ